MKTNFIKTQQTRKATRTQSTKDTTPNQWQASNKESNISRRLQRRNKASLQGVMA